MSVGGSAVANGGSASLSYGASTTIAATPASGYNFSGWTVTNGAANATIGNAANASTTVTLTGAATLTAAFTVDSGSAGGGGTGVPGNVSVAVSGASSITASGGSWTAVVSGTSGTLSYMWFVDGSMIAGATSAAYMGTAGVSNGTHTIGCLVTVDGVYSYSSNSYIFTASGM